VNHTSRRLMLLVVLLVLGSLALAACEPKTEIVEKVVKEAVVEKEVVKEAAPEAVTEAPPASGETESAPTAAPQGSGGGAIIRGDFADAESLNPILFTDNASDIVCQMMYNALVQVNPDDTTVMPDLAERWEVSDDNLTFTYYLRKDVTWHDGEPFTAHDVKFTYEAILNPEINSPRRADFVDLLSPDNIVVVDDHTIRFTLNRIDASWLCCKDIYGILPKHILGDLTPAGFNAAAFNTSEPVGTGPYMFHEWVKDDHVALVSNPNYFDGAPQPEYWYYKVVENETVAFAQLQTGEVDYAVVSAALWEQAQQVEHLDCTSYPRFAFTFYTYNLDPEKTPLFLDVRTRQALLYALDREAMVDSIVFGLGDVAHSTVPPVSWAHNPDNEPVYPYDPERAKKLLDEAGWKDEDGDGVREAHGVEGVTDGTKLSFDLETNAGNQEREQVIQAMQHYWAQIGVEARTAGVEWNALLAKLTETFDFDVIVVGFNWDIDPDQRTMWHTDSYQAGFNVNRYSNPQVDEHLDAALQTVDMEERKVHYYAMQRILAEEAPSPILYFRQGTECWNTRLHEYHANDINPYYNAHEWWVGR